MKWFKRVLLLVVVLLLAGLIAAVVARYMYRSTPSWYHHHPLTEEQAKIATNQALQKFSAMLDWTAGVQAQETRRRNGTAKSETPIGPTTFTFTEQDIDSFANVWINPDTAQLRQKLANDFSDVRLALLENQIVLGGDSKESDAFISVQLEPSLDDQNRLWLKLAGVFAGRLPLPQSMVSERLQKLKTAMRDELAKEQINADIDSTGTANGSAAAASGLWMLLNTLDNHPSDPVLFIPYDLRDARRSVPVLLTAVKITEGSITVTLAPMPRGDQAALLARIRHPYIEPAPEQP